MDRNYAKVLSETRAGRIIGDFILYFSILLFPKFSRMKLLLLKNDFKIFLNDFILG